MNEERSEQPSWAKYRDKRIVYLNMLRALKFHAPGAFTVEEWRGLCAQYGHVCAHCRAKVPLTADHIVPLTRGGSNDITNIQPLCRACNSRKSNILPGDVMVREPVQPLPIEYSENWGGIRAGAGRYCSRLALDKDAAHDLATLVRQWRLERNCPELTEEEVIVELIRIALQTEM